MSHYNQGSAGYHRGGHNGHRSAGYIKINQDEVPESQHSIFIRGLPSSVSTDVIKDFFEDNVGPCSFDFQKVIYEKQSIFVAVRFESKDDAKRAYNRYQHEDILGCRCEVTWYRDVRRYIAYQREKGAIRGGSFGRGRGGMGSYHRNDRQDYRKRRYSDDRRRSPSRSDSDSSRSPSPRRGRSSRRSISRSSSRSEGERSPSRESDRRRSKSREGKRREKEENKQRSNRRESDSSDGERSRSSSSERDEKKGGRKRTETDRAVSPDSTTPFILAPPPIAPIIMPSAIPTATASIENPGPLRITIANKTAAPVENTSFREALDSGEPPRKIIRISPTPEKKNDNFENEDMDVEEKEEDEEVRMEEQKKIGGWTTVGGDIPSSPSDELPSTTALIQPRIAKVLVEDPKEIDNIQKPVDTTILPSPMRNSSASSIAPLPSTARNGGPLALKCPEMARTVSTVKSIQDQLISSVKPDVLRLSSDFSSGESMMDKMEERERIIKELPPAQKNKLDVKMRQFVNSFRGDASTITTVLNSIVQKDPSLEEKIKPALLSVLEDLEKQIYKKVDDFLICGL